MRVTMLHPDAVLPSRGTPGSAGLDLSSVEEVVVPSRGGVVPVRTGLAVSVPVDAYGRVAPRSGLAMRHGIDVAAGVVDSDYRGEVVVLLMNHHPHADYVVRKGDRVAQLILERIHVLTPVLVATLEELTEGPDVNGDRARGAGGFGSTGRA